MASTYASTTAIMVGRGLDNPDVSAQTIYLSNQLATTYAQMASREPVMRGVVDALKLPISWQQLKGMVKAQPQPGSPLFEIKVISTNPQLSQALAAETARQLIVQSASERLKDEQGDSIFLHTPRSISCAAASRASPPRSTAPRSRSTSRPPPASSPSCRAA